MSPITKIAAGLALVVVLAMGITSLALCQSANLAPLGASRQASAQQAEPAYSSPEQPIPPDPWDIQLDAPRPY